MGVLAGRDGENLNQVEQQSGFESGKLNLVVQRSGCNSSLQCRQLVINGLCGRFHDSSKAHLIERSIH